MSTIRSRPLSQIAPTPLHWLWEGYLPRGQLALLDGDPGIGKSLLTIDLAARLSRGGEMPNAPPAGRPHVTILLGTEDNSADIIAPRAAAAGADPERVIIPEDEDIAKLSFPADSPDLEQLICTHAADLVVIDPIVSFLPSSIASSTDHGVRKSLSPLAAVARRTDCTILMVRHLRKAEGGRALYRGIGSIGFIAAARVGLFAATHPIDPSKQVLTVSKLNATNRGGSLAYRIQSNAAGAPLIDWAGPVGLSADAANRRLEAPLKMRDRASEWLTAQLADGPRRSTELLAASAEIGIPEKTLRRAKDELRIGVRRVYGKESSEWYWYDPTAAWPANAPFKKPRPGELPPIEDYIA